MSVPRHYYRVRHRSINQIKIKRPYHVPSKRQVYLYFKRNIADHLGGKWIGGFL